MVELMQPQLDDIICDPSAGTAGFLVAAKEYIDTHYSVTDLDKKRKHINEEMFNGTEFDATMLRIASMNLYLHGVEEPNIRDVDAVSKDNTVANAYTLVLANPPFKGTIDKESIAVGLKNVTNTSKTELLFLALMLRELKTGGRAAVIVPDGVLFGSSKAHQSIRQEIVENQKLDAVISMPSGVFKPYAGVSTAILFFTKTNSGGTDNVWFYDMKADGYSLDDKRAEIKDNDIPDIVKRFKNLEAETERVRTDSSFLVPFKEIKENDWDLSINRYKEVVYEEIEYDEPQVLIEGIRSLDTKRIEALKNIEKLIG